METVGLLAWVNGTAFIGGVEVGARLSPRVAVLPKLVGTVDLLGANRMRTYVITTGAMFGLLVIAHIWRMIEENAELATDPAYLAITVAAAALCLWAVRLVTRSSRA